MGDDCNNDIRDIIESKQEELNKLLESETVDKSKALELSLELDKLIYKYYCYKM